MANLDIAPHFSERDRELQARHAVIWPHAKLAAAAHMKPQSVSCIASAVYPVTVFRAFEFAHIQQSYTLIRTLAARIGALLVLRRDLILPCPTIHLLARLMTSLDEFLPLAEKVRAETPLTDEQMQTFTEEAEKAKQAIDALLEQARQQRANKE